jgi:Protein of unknown function (DUF1194)
VLSRRRLLKKLFKGVTAASAAVIVTGFLTAGSPLAFAQDELFPDVRESYRHKALASDSNDPVGVQLILAMDTSLSMDPYEYDVQVQAIAYALNSELFRNVVKYRTSGDRSVAIAVIEFDSVARLRVPWVDIRRGEIND